MGTEVLLPSKGLELLLLERSRSACTSSLSLSQTVLRRKNNNLGFSKNNQRVAPSPPWAEGRLGAAPEPVWLQLLVGLSGDPI